MKNILSDKVLLQLSNFISDNLALNFPKERWYDLERNIISATKEFGYDDVEKFILHIITTPLTHEHIEILSANLTINETYFWREPQTFEAMEQTVLPKLIRDRKNSEKRLRIWSAGCSTGEEPYSIAILLKRLIPDIKEWNISILATDISPRILQKAISGEYRQWSFRGTPDWLKENYFIQKPNNMFEIIPEIKKMVKFEYLNLADDIYPSSINNTNAIDIIYCRNVLMYFTQNRFRQVVGSLYKSLVQDGYLVVSASELSMQNFEEFTPVNVPGMVLYQKNNEKQKKPFTFTAVESKTEPLVFRTALRPELPVELKISKPIKPEKEKIKTVEKYARIDESINKESLSAHQENNLTDTTGNKKSADDWILTIRAFANEGKLSEAIDASKSAIAENKTDARLHYLYATILQEYEALDEAVSSLKRAIYLDTNFVLAYYSLEKIYERLGNYQKADKCYNNALSILNKCGQDEILFESEGLTVGRFKEIINASKQTRV